MPTKEGIRTLKGHEHGSLQPYEYLILKESEMHQDRLLEIEMNGQPLTEEEKKEGWHFCLDWDFMLIGPGMSELEACTCPRKESKSE